MKQSRNDPCACGSGKKFKHCCLNAGANLASAPADLLWHRMRALLDGHAIKMINFVQDAYGQSAIIEAWSAFTRRDGVELDPASPLMQLFWPWAFYYWVPDPADTEVKAKSLHGLRPAEAYLAAKGRRLDPPLRHYLESLLIAPFTFFEVMACDPGQGITLRDVMTQEEYAVTERSASKGVQRGDLLFGQLASVDSLTMLEASNGFPISPVEKARIIALRAHLVAECQVLTRQVLRDHNSELLDLFHEIAERALSPKLPSLRNTDDEPLVPHKLVFDLTVTPQAAFDALKHLALDQSDEELLADAIRDAEGKFTQVVFRWMKRGNKIHAGWDNTALGTIEIDGARLTAEVNSAARAKAIRGLIESQLGSGIRYRASKIQSLEKMLAGAKAAAGGPSSAAALESQRLIELPEIREKIAAMAAAHWEQWVDRPIPLLGNRTPIDAIKDADGREIVESLIIQAERQISNVPIDPAVFQRLRKRLGFAEN